MVNPAPLVTTPVQTLWIAAGAAALAGTLAAGLYLAGRGPAEDAELVRVLEQFAATGAEHARPEACIACHREETERWAVSHHALANAALTAVDRARLLERADPLLAARGMRWRAGQRAPLLEEEGLPPYPVVGTIGITPLIQYLHLAPDGRIQTHDVAWDPQLGEWFTIYEDEPGPPRMPGEWGHWTGQGMNWDANCAWCHMTAYRKNYDVEADLYHREWEHMAITCSQCHPGMPTHLSQIRNGNNYFKEDLTPTQYMDTCATCHSLRDELTPHLFEPGDRYADHFQLILADRDGLYHPDGQVIGENYVYGSLTMSRMGAAGVTCMDCHDSHSMDFILPVDNNALCQRCHGSGLMDAPRVDPVRHSHHKPDSTGNLCIECHMPTTTYMGRDPRRDHSFSNPDPRLTIEMGIPNACTHCHNTQSVEWSLKYAEEWYGPDMNAARRARARLMRDLWDGVDGAGERLKAALLEERNRFWRATYVAMFQYVPLDREGYDLLVACLDDPDPLVRATAVRHLGPDALAPARRQRLMQDPVRAVRIAAALSGPSLAGLPPSLDAELRAYLEHTSDNVMGALRLSSYRLANGDSEGARMLARRSVQFDHLNPEAHRLAAIQLSATGDDNAALDFLRQALAMDDQQPLVQFNLGILLAGMGDNRQALHHLGAAVELDPALEGAWYNLVVLHWQMQDMAAARQRMAAALAALPNSQRLRQLARQMPPAGN